jgi:menaquinone-dependent protoporphyrinogen IX oxidase
MNDIQSHLKRFPKARPSTLAFIEAKRAKTEQLQREIEEAKRSPNYLLLIAGRLRVLAIKARELVN